MRSVISRPCALRRSLSARTSSRARPSARSSSSSVSVERDRVARRPARARAPRAAAARISTSSALERHGLAVDVEVVRAAASSSARRTVGAVERRRAAPSPRAPACRPSARARGSSARPCSRGAPRGRRRPRALHVELVGDLGDHVGATAPCRRGAATSARRSGWRTLSLASVRAARPSDDELAGERPSRLRARRRSPRRRRRASR